MLSPCFNSTSIVSNYEIILYFCFSIWGFLIHLRPLRILQKSKLALLSIRIKIYLTFCRFNFITRFQISWLFCFAVYTFLLKLLTKFMTWISSNSITLLMSYSYRDGGVMDRSSEWGIGDPFVLLTHSLDSSLSPHYG